MSFLRVILTVYLIMNKNFKDFIFIVLLCFLNLVKIK